MRILHTSDWHLGKRLGQFSRLREQSIVLEEIVQITNHLQADAVIISGDLWDAFNPSADASELLYKTLKDLTNFGHRLVVAIAGNHDAPERVEAPEMLARECGILLCGFPFTRPSLFQLAGGAAVSLTAPGFAQLTFPQFNYPLRLLLTPYANELRMRQFLGINATEGLRDALRQHWRNTADNYCDSKGVNVLVSHLFMTDGKIVRPEEPLDEARPIVTVGGAGEMFASMVPDQIQYVAMGHLHRRIITAKEPIPVVYPGSILQYSFSEAGQPKFVEVVDVEPGKTVHHYPYELKSVWPLIRHKAESSEAAIQWLSELPKESYVELTIITPDFLSAEVVKAIHSTHPGIVQIIPQREQTSSDESGQRQSLPDPGKEISQLFIEYFQSRHGVLPDKETMALFEEVIGGSITDETLIPAN